MASSPTSVQGPRKQLACYLPNRKGVCPQVHDMCNVIIGGAGSIPVGHALNKGPDRSFGIARYHGEVVTARRSDNRRLAPFCLARDEPPCLDGGNGSLRCPSPLLVARAWPLRQAAALGPGEDSTGCRVIC